jgi:hypothetical protein
MTQALELARLNPVQEPAVGDSVVVKATEPTETEWQPATGGGGTGGVNSVAGKTGDVVLIHSDISDWNSSTPFLPLSGGSISGPLTLPADPTQPLQAASKQYVDANAGGGGGGGITEAEADLRYLQLAGGNLSGFLSLVAKPSGISEAEADQRYLQLVGGDLSGPLSVSGELTAMSDLKVNGSASVAGALTVSTTLEVNGASSFGAVNAGSGSFSGPLTLAADPTQPLHAATKEYVDAHAGGLTEAEADLRYLQLAGGDLTGSLTVGGALQVNSFANFASSLTANAIYPAYATSPSWYMGPNGTLHYTQHLAGYYDYWDSNGGGRGWVGNNTLLMGLDPSGNLSVHGSISAPGNANVSGTTTVNYLSGQNGAMAGNWSVSGTCTCSYVTCNSTFTCYAGANVSSTISGSEIVGHSTLGMQYAAWSGFWYAFSHVSNGLYVQVNGANFGAITFTSGCDDRIKDVVGPSPYGLREILATEPLTFTYKHNHSFAQPNETSLPRRHDTPARPEVPKAPPDTRLHVGISAQQQEQIMPEMIGSADGFIDGQPVDDLRGFIYHEWITYALVNAVKELAARVAALEATHA